MKNATTTLLAASTVAALLATSSHAAITGVGGSTVFLGVAPPSATWTALPGAPAYCWDEQTGVNVSALNVNITANGLYTGPAINAGVISGTFDSHFIHFDASQGIANVTGSVTFSGQILAVIYEGVLLDNTDGSLGSFGTVYPTGDPFRSTGPSLFMTQLVVAGNTLSFDLWTQNAAMPNRMSQLRVLTDGVVPAPGALALLALGGCAARRRQR